LSRFIKDKLQVNSLNISNINNSLSAANFLEKIHFGSYLAGLRKTNFSTLNPKDIQKLPNELDEILIGLILGDLHIDFTHNNARLFFEQGESHSLYLEHFYDMFKDFYQTKPKIVTRFDKRTNQNFTHIKFKTLTSPLFNYYHTLFYHNNNKIIPINLNKILTAKSLAY
jgi:hypothetical protein